MRLLILSFYYEPDLCAGSFRCSALVKQLLARDYPGLKTEVLTTLPQRYATYKVGAPAQEMYQGLLVRRFKVSKHSSGPVDQIKAFASYAKQVRKWVSGRSYDLIFATSSRLMTATLGAFIAQSKKIPLYLDIRDLLVDTLHDLLPRSLQWCLIPGLSWLEKWTFRRATIINVVSGGFVDYVKKRHPQAILRTFPNGIDSEFFVEKSARMKPPLMTVVYAGNIGEGQGLHRIIPLLAKQLEGKAKFIIVGDGGRKIALKKALSEAHCVNVEMIDPMHRNDLVQLYLKADVLFLHLNNLPAFKRVLPSKIFEYAAMDKPIWAGVAGYSNYFLLNELTNVAIFPPCDAERAVLALSSLSLELTKRTEFMQKYDRAMMMGQMAEDIFSTVECG